MHTVTDCKVSEFCNNSHLQVQTGITVISVSSNKADLYPMNRDIFEELHLSVAEEKAAGEENPNGRMLL
jgi:hypothetical protein